MKIHGNSLENFRKFFEKRSKFFGRTGEFQKMFRKSKSSKVIGHFEKLLLLVAGVLTINTTYNYNKASKKK